MSKPKPNKPDPTGRLVRHKKMAPTSKTVQARLDRQESLCNYLKAHPKSTLTAALAELGIPISTYEDWRQRHPDFVARLDALRIALRESGDVRYLGDFTTFRKAYFGFDTYYHQQLIVQAIEKAQPQSVTMVLVPPEHGKTTVIEDWICFKLATEPNTRITIVSEGQPHARKILRRVKSRLTDTRSKLYADFGPFYEPQQERSGKPWQADFFTVFKADHDERDYSLEARGWNSAIAGTRTDYLIIDDVTSRRNVSQTTRVVDTLRQDFFTRPGRDGHTIIVGTRVDIDDVYEKLLDATNERGEQLVSEAIICPAISDDGKSLCPEMWSEPELERKRAIVGESVWWRNYQQKPRAAGELSFTPELLDKTKNRMAVLGEKLAGGHTIMGLDPALGGGNALVVWSYTDAVMRVIDVRRDFNLARTEQILAAVEELAAKHRPEDLVIETMAFQRSLAGDDRMHELSERFGFRLLPHLTGSGGFSKLDEALGVASMATDMRTGELELVWGDDATRDRMESLVAELGAWRPDVKTRFLRQDMVMAMWFGWIVMKNRRRVLSTMSVAGGWKMKGSPVGFTDYQALRRKGA